VDAETYVDELFARYEPTPELEDFREEVLGNLHARIAQLTDEGVTPSEAARRAQTELGDIDEIAREMSRGRVIDVYNHMYLHQRVRPSTSRVVALVGLAILVLVGLLSYAVFAAAVIVDEIHSRSPIDPGMWVSEAPTAYPYGLVGAILIALSVGTMVAVGLTTETTAHAPMRTARAIVFGGSITFAVGGPLVGVAIAFGVWISDDFVRVPWISFVFGGVLGGALFVIGLGTAIVLGVTGTNRTKPWVRREQLRQAELQVDNFSTDPALAARFGMYVVALWTAAIVVLVVLVLVGLPQWCWIPIPLAIAVMMLLIARMGFSRKVVDK
jgi:MFS family permease